MIEMFCDCVPQTIELQQNGMCSLLPVCYTDLYADFGVFERLTQLDKAFPGANVLLFKQGILPKVSENADHLDELHMTIVVSVFCAL